MDLTTLIGLWWSSDNIRHRISHQPHIRDGRLLLQLQDYLAVWTREGSDGWTSWECHQIHLYFIHHMALARASL